ncbi:MAG: succinate dehydrogenase, cytochrome b556 subunit [Pseudomonadota bacterium]
MADVNRGNRPLSPHLQVYRPQLNSITSIINRITGAGLNVTFILLVAWLLAAAWSPEAFAFVDGLLTSTLGSIILIASLWALWYHFCGGLRHLIWDTGAGFDLKFVDASGWAIIIASFVLTGLTLLLVL